MNDISLYNPGGSSKTTQIDHIVVSIYRIFVLETKNYTGLVYGTDYSKSWTHFIKSNEYKFMNPIN